MARKSSIFRHLAVPTLLIVLVSSGNFSVWAASGTEGAAFLNIPAGARPASMGSAYSALATDVYAPVWNPAGLGNLNGLQFEGQHLSYLESIHYEHTSAVFPLKKDRGLGVAIQYLGTGDIAATEPNGNSLGDFSARYAAYSIAYGQKMAPHWSLGVTGKIIDAKISNISAKAYAADIGSLYQPNSKMQLAGTIVNLGSKLTFTDQGDSLPLAFRLGGAYWVDRTLILAAEGQFRKSGQSGIHFGVDWKPLNEISLRAGYKTETSRQLSAVAGLSVGLGLHLFGQELAYAWLPYGDLGDTHYVSLHLTFGASPETSRNLEPARAAISKEPLEAKGTDLENSTHTDLLEFLNDAEKSAVVVRKK